MKTKIKTIAILALALVTIAGAADSFARGNGVLKGKNAREARNKCVCSGTSPNKVCEVRVKAQFQPRTLNDIVDCSQKPTAKAKYVCEQNKQFREAKFSINEAIRQADFDGRQALFDLACTQKAMIKNFQEPSTGN